MTSKVHNVSLKDAAGGSEGGMMSKAQEEALKNERIAAGVNRSTFLHLGEKKKTLVSETESSLLRRQKAPTTTRSANSAISTAYMTEAQRRDQVYITDDSVPSMIFPLIESYRQKVMDMAMGGQPSALIIDDFFGEAHSILKDTHLKEIARIRNENNVDVMKLKKSLEEKLVVEGGYQPKHAAGQFDKSGDRARANQAALQQANLFADNEAERQRRQLTEENELLKRRVRAQENIMQSSTLERAKFMEGASWLAKKGAQEASKGSQKLKNLSMEFDQRAIKCLRDQNPIDVDGQQFLEMKDWMSQCLMLEADDMAQKFDVMLENVNYHLSEATKGH